MISGIVPQKYHSALMPHLIPHMERCVKYKEDEFPKYYRCNTISKLKKIMNVYGIKAVVFGHGAEPSYLSFSRMLFRIFCIFHKLAPGFIQPTIFAFGKIDKSG